MTPESSNANHEAIIRRLLAAAKQAEEVLGTVKDPRGNIGVGVARGRLQVVIAAAEKHLGEPNRERAEALLRDLYDSGELDAAAERQVEEVLGERES